MKEKFRIQDEQYSLPYHYTFKRTKNKFHRFFGMNWAIEYFVYNDWILNNIKNLDYKNVIEVGCGDGYLISQIAKNTTENKFVGYDLSKRSIDLAKTFGNRNVTFFNEDISELNNEEYDLVLCSQVLEHIPDNEVDDFIENLIRITKPNKYIVIVVPGIGKKLIKKHYRHYSPKTLLNLFDSKTFEIIKSDTIFHIDFSYNFFMKMTVNRFYQLDIPLINNWFIKKMDKKINKNNNNYYNVGLILKKVC